MFYEIDLKRKIWDTIGVIGEVNDTPGVNNAISRIGLFMIPEGSLLDSLNTTLFFKAFPVGSDGQG